MPVPIFPPARESDLLAWSANFNEKINLAAATYGLTAPQAEAYNLLHGAFETAYNTAINPNTNSKANVEFKNTAKQNLLYGIGGAWQLVNLCQAFPDMNNDLRAALNIRVPDTQPTPAPVPDSSPDIDIISTFGHTIKLRVHESGSPKSGKPEGVKGASLFYFVGDEPPSAVNQWSFGANTTKNVIDVVLPSETAAGAKVWLTAFWFNNRMQSGPAATPVGIHVPGGLSVAA